MTNDAINNLTDEERKMLSETIFKIVEILEHELTKKEIEESGKIAKKLVRLTMADWYKEFTIQ